MMGKKIRITGFVLLALVQLLIPARMIWEQEHILKKGTEYKFKTAPVYPNDPFRGKYITLSYEASSFNVANEMDWEYGQTIYVVLTTDQKGFAKIASITSEVPIGYPFDRFYMEESKAQPAEITYRNSQRDTTTTTYALVRVKNGKAVLKDVLIDGVPIKELVGKERTGND